MFLWRSQSALHWGVWEVTWGVILTFAGIASSGEDEGEGGGSLELLVNLVWDERQWIEVVRSERVEELRKNNPPRSTTLKGSVYVWESYWSLRKREGAEKEWKWRKGERETTESDEEDFAASCVAASSSTCVFLKSRTRKVLQSISVIICHQWWFTKENSLLQVLPIYSDWSKPQGGITSGIIISVIIIIIIITSPWGGANKPDLFRAIAFKRIIQMTWFFGFAPKIKINCHLIF